MSHPTLLIVDDEKPTRDGLRAALEHDYDVYVAEDAGAVGEHGVDEAECLAVGGDLEGAEELGELGRGHRGAAGRDEGEAGDPLGAGAGVADGGQAAHRVAD